MEIERKYLVRKMPDSLESYEALEMYQAYLCAGPVIRVRSIARGGTTEYILTVKGRGMIIREEHELPLSKEKYELLLGKREGRVIHKMRYRIPMEDGHAAELDVFCDELEGLRTVEVEFTSEEDMNAFVKPEWFGEDVSLDARYKNSTLCMAPQIAHFDKKS